MKPRIVVSGVNFIEGGPLAVFQDALQVLSDRFAEQYEIVALVHRRSLFSAGNVTYLEFPEVKQSWGNRLRFEYRDCLPLSRRLQSTLWLALHDMTPRVEAERQAVYCHNPSPFLRMTLSESKLDRTQTAFALLYRYLYRIGIRRNNFVVVQQQWMREAFQRRYRPRAVVVAHPSVAHLHELSTDAAPHRKSEPWRFFYPAFPRVFKNVQVLLQAAHWLESNTDERFELGLTLTGTENPYARWLFQQYGHLRSARWLGLLPRATVFEHYHAADAMLFPSKLETWGMPLSEFQNTGKPVFAADLPYAHETLAGYAPVHFFPPDDGPALGEAMRNFMRGDLMLEGAAPFTPPAPFTENWEQLFGLLLQDVTPREPRYPATL